MHRALSMLGLIIAGEAVFALPFHVARFFRPTVLEVFALTNTELGAAQGAYGVLAMLAYFPGGPLADRFPARKLLALSLWTTAAGGLYMATFPGYAGAVFLWGFFGVTTILFFWAALIRATRNWGGADAQGRAYGLLDGGRGLLAAVLATAGVAVFGWVFPADHATAALAEKEQALRLVIYGYTAVTALAGLLVWFVIPDGGDERAARWRPEDENFRTHISQVLRMPAVWLQAVIVVCAYVGYKGFDNYSLYAVQGYGLDEVEAASVVTLGSWMRPIAAVGAGLLGDRFTVSRMTVVAFALLLISDLVFAITTPAPGMAWVLTGNILIACTAIFGLRALYFALFEEARVPPAMTGTAVGLVSVVGFTPDIFVGLVGGIILDASPGLAGHQNYFFFLAAFAGAGLAAGLLLMRRLNRLRAAEAG